MMLQIDGYYGAVGTVEVSVTTAAADAWTVSAGVQDLSCSLLTSFDPNGSISVNSNVGIEAVAWTWEGPFGFTSDAASIGPLLPGDYTLEASFCGQTFSASYEVEEPAPLELVVSLSPDCALGSTSGVVDIEGGQGVATATWTSGAFGTSGVEVSGLQEACLRSMWSMKMVARLRKSFGLKASVCPRWTWGRINLDVPGMRSPCSPPWVQG